MQRFRLDMTLRFSRRCGFIACLETRSAEWSCLSERLSFSCLPEFWLLLELVQLSRHLELLPSPLLCLYKLGRPRCLLVVEIWLLTIFVLPIAPLASSVER
jgi:hypothetical protein